MHGRLCAWGISFGKVYRAEWRGAEVAVKEIKLPMDPTVNDKSAHVQEVYRQQLIEINEDFVSEVNVLCNLSHPHLVRLLGFATQPTLLIMQELLRGDSLDKQLYVARWRPTRAQTHQIALDTAQGMAYLHTAFQDCDSCDCPIIHRDLKSPNLVLSAPPPRGEDDPGETFTVKITDFGLSKDKALGAAKQTLMMTGCGSVLWMAPEILLGSQYNESVDVFAFAMTMVEVISGHLPWSGIATPESVPLRVSQGEVPTQQIRSGSRGMRRLVRQCWQKEAGRRPTFTQVVATLRDMAAFGEEAEPQDIGGLE